MSMPEMEAPRPETTQLVVSDVLMAFGGVRALDRVNFWVPAGGAVGLLGQNGSGKTTLLNVITGQLRPEAGSVHFDGRSMIGLRPDAYAKAGISRVFQSVQVFPSLTVGENLSVARLGSGAPRMSGTSNDGVLERVGLADFATVVARDLSYGHQRLLEIAMALAARAKLVLFDEPTAGLSSDVADRVIACLRDLRASGTAMIVIEHETDVVFQTCEVVWVLNEGRFIARGTPDEIKADPMVLELYLGRRAA
jgi:ABC-type branched-subunit amino acid transport system ATPase component